MDLALAGAFVIVLGVIMYVVLDGFDLGIGILFPFAADEGERDVMMNSVAPIWDGNETWLVLGGTILFGAFPLAYSLLLPALYIPLIVMLFGLVLRGIAFEFRFKANSGRWAWGLSFTAGSVLATFAQGVVLGTFITGFEVAGGAIRMAPFGWLSPFSLFTGLALLAGYALLGAAWLVMKTDGALQDWAFRCARLLVLCVIACIAVVSLWTALTIGRIAERWFSLPNILFLWPVPLVTGGLAIALWTAVARRSERLPFLLAIGLFLLSYAGLGISLWPAIVPPSLTIWDAAARPASLAFLLAGVAVIVPVILAYTAFSYYVFRGKVRSGEGYH